MRKNPYVKSVNVRLSENDYEILVRFADESNQRLGEFVRNILQDYLNREQKEVE